MNLAYAWHQTGCSLQGFPSCIFADLRPDFQRGSQPALQAFSCQAASLASHRSRNQNDSMGTNLTKIPAWLADQQICPWQKLRQLNTVLLTQSDVNFSTCLRRDGRCKEGPAPNFWRQVLASSHSWADFLIALHPLPCEQQKEQKSGRLIPMGALWRATNHPIFVTAHAQTSCLLGSRGWQH